MMKGIGKIKKKIVGEEMTNVKVQSSNLEIKVKAEVEVKLKRINSKP
jgi:hypothetical protein